MTTAQRIQSAKLWELLPATSHAIEALGRSGTAAGLDNTLIELINLRCSQLNGCAYCCHYHTRNLLNAGADPLRLSLLPAWSEAGDIFSEREKAALAWAEALTRLAETHAPDALYADLTGVFSDAEIADLTVQISTINVWNRISVGFRLAPALSVANDSTDFG